MVLNKLNLTNFKNHRDRAFEFDPKVNALAGNNGVGKTNLMDAIYYLGMTKSYFNVFDFKNVRSGSDFFRLEGVFEQAKGRFSVVCKVKKGKKKVIEVDGDTIPQLSHHIGRINMIFIAPDDNLIILGGSEERRRFIDNTISQFDSSYLSHLLHYNKALKHRNALLKQFAAEDRFDRTLLHAFNARLIDHGLPIHRKRKQLFERFSDIMDACYRRLSSSKEHIQITYVSQLDREALDNLLLLNEEKDRILQRTTCGLHKDDISFEMDGHKVKKFSSQGQQKSFLFALKLGQFEVIDQEKTETPILLIDDVFDKLDTARSANLLQIISQPPFQQVFISDTNHERLKAIFDDISVDIRIFDI